MNKPVAIAIVVAVVILLGLPLAAHFMKSQGDDEPAPAPVREAPVSDSPLTKTVSVDIDQSPHGGRLTVQFAVMEVCKAAGMKYQWEKSRELADDYCRNYIQPVHIHNVTAEEALAQILSPVNGSYDCDANGLYLK